MEVEDTLCQIALHKQKGHINNEGQEERGSKEMHAVLLGSKKVKSKAVPLHAMEAHGGRGGITPTHT
jgi:hypothetical protein